MQIFMRRPNLGNLPPVTLPAGYEIRPARPEDEAALASLLAHAFPEMEWWNIEQVQERLTHANDVKRTFVITHQSVPVATASARVMPEEHPGSGYLHWVAGQSSHKGRGLGKQVSLAVLHEFIALGCQNAVLETDEFRLPAIKTYLDMGFVPEHRQESDAQSWENVFKKLNARN